MWFHAVSVGEAETLFPLIKTLLQKKPATSILVTTTTPTGSARVKTVLKNTVQHVYLPYDIPSTVNRFMVQFKPRVAVMMETEIWPNLFRHCREHNIPLYIINARLSERSTRGYQKISALIKPALAHASILTQSQQDTERFIAIGAVAQQVATLGNMKFDIGNPQDLLEQGLAIKASLFSKRFVWLIASTHQGEETLFLAIYQEIKQRIPELLLVIVPRHPERFSEVKKLCEQQPLNVITRTSQKNIDTGTDVYLLDTMGELRSFYATADVAFVGGSMVSVGGHNILEAAAVGVPVMFGPFMANFKAITDNVLNAEAALQCHNKQALIVAITSLYQDPVYRATLAQKGKAFVASNTGVVMKVYDRLAKHITPPCSSY
jgi:3-deoxy-D-manno-octulosonic-acid transferase